MSAQARFRTALLAPDLPVPEGLHDGRGGTATRRFAVYRNNVAVGLSDAVVEGFPTLERLIGIENLQRIAGVFLRTHPPDSPVMFSYGTEMPGFLEGFAPLSHMPYLPDIARLDLALRAAYHAADAPVMSDEALAELPPEHLDEARLRLVPAARLLRSRWPLYDIWRKARDPEAPNPGARAQDILITRPEYAPRPQLLPQGGAAFVVALQQWQSLYHATTTARLSDETLSALLGLLMRTQSISDVEIPS